jgi:hypothetical protein
MTLVLVLVISAFVAASELQEPAAARIFLDDCEPAYPEICVPLEEEVGDLNCGDLNFSNFIVLDPDPHGFDVDLDGVGYETVAPAGSTEAADILATDGILAADCDPSYPDACVPPPPPDLNCADIGFALGVIHDPDEGATDPHGLDPDGDGEGCTSLGP